jgi:hypothetical protein
MRAEKSRRIIAAQEVSAVFDDACLAELAKIARLPPSADRAAFAASIRGAARIFARDARIPTRNDLHAEIGELHRAADGQRYNEVFDLLESLSPAARALLQDRAARIGIELPPSDGLRDPERRKEACQEACQAITRLSQFGGRWAEGRRRPSGKQSRPVWRPLLWASEPRRNFWKRNAERDFVMWISIAWQQAVGTPPTRTARHRDASRDVGPFARFVSECLRLVGAGDADVVELLNEMDRRRREMERRTGKGPE